jgi:hypothetical protein
MTAYILMVEADIGRGQGLLFDQGAVPNIGGIGKPKVGDIARKRFICPIRGLCGKTDTGKHCTGGLFGFIAALFRSPGKNPG